jgi:hypothetical protein
MSPGFGRCCSSCVCKYQNNARYVHTMREGPGCQDNVHSNLVHQSTSSWWLVRKF